MARVSRSGGLATSLVTLVLTAVGLAVAAISITAIAGVLELASDQVAARQQVFSEAAVVELRVHLNGALRAMYRSSSELIDPETGELDLQGLTVQYEAASEFVDRTVVADSEGNILGVVPAWVTAQTLQDNPLLGQSFSDTPTFIYDDESQELWLVRSIEDPSGELVLMERLRMSYLHGLLDGFASESENRWTGVFSEDGLTISASDVGPEIDLASLEFEQFDEDTGSGTVSASTKDGTVLWGQYARIGSYDGIGWSTVVMEPRSKIVAATVSALSPAVIALLVSAALSIILAGVFARRLTVPLRSIETRAREAVSGAYVRPIETDRTDELGRLVEAFNAIALRLNALHDLSQLLAGTSSLDQVLDGILSAMGHIVGSARAAVFLLEDDGEHLTLARSRGLDKTSELVVPTEESTWLTEALSAAGPMAAEGVPLDHCASLGLHEDCAVKVLAAPLVVGNDPLGVVAVFDDRDRDFSQAETEMVRTFSAQAAIAVQNSRLFEIESVSRREAEMLQAVAEQLATAIGLEDSLREALRLAEEMLDVATAVVAIVDRSSLGLPPAEESAEERLLLRAWGRATVLRGDEECMVVGRGEDGVIDAFLLEHGGTGVMLVTATRGKEPGAVLGFILDRQDRTFSDQEIHLAESVGKQVSLALENAFHYEQARHRALNLETIFRISQAVSSSLEVKQVLSRVLDVVQKIFSASAVSLMTHDETTKIIETAMARGNISNEMLHFSCMPGEDVPGMVFKTAAPAKIDDMEQSEGSFAKMAVAQGLHSALSVPLLARARSLGVLTIFGMEPALFTEEDMSLLHTFASQAALALDTADMFGREHMVSSVLQASILPEILPPFDEVETASVYRAAGVEAEIGGDYYDMFRRPDGDLIVAIGDVAGKGVVAATKTSMIKYTLRGLAATGLSPSEMMADLNRTVTETGEPSDIVTLWVGVLSRGGTRLCYANAGHPPALLRRARDSDVVRLSPTGPLLGATVTAVYEEEVVDLKSQDSMLLYTDGVTEARRGHKFFGEGRVRRVLRYGGSPQEVVERLLRAIDEFVPGELRDDAAILAFRVTGTGKTSKQKRT